MSNSLTSEPSTLSGQAVENLAEDVYVFSATYAQQRFWFLSQFESDSAFYNVPAAIRLQGRLDIPALEQSLNEIVRRHESLRTIFVEVDGQPMQAVFPSQRRLSLPVVDLTGLAFAEKERALSSLIAEETGKPFELSQWPLLRVRLLRLDKDHHVFVLTMHHIISDGWSLGVFAKELAALYEGYAKGAPIRLPELSLQYADYAVWQREWLKGEVLEEQLSYWRRQLSGTPAVLELPTDRPRPPVQSFKGAEHTFILPKGLSESLKNLSREEGATLFMTLLAALDVLFYRYTGQNDIWVGSPIANRKPIEVEGMIGLFVNTLVFRTDLSGNPTFRELLKKVREVSFGAYTHQDLPFEKLVEELRPERDLSRAPLFQVMFVLQNAPMPEMKLSDLTLSFIDVDTKTAKFDLSISISENADDLSGSIRYNTDLFDASTIERFVGHLQTILQAVAADSSQRIDHLPLLTEAEREHLLVELSQPRRESPPAAPLHELFEAQVERTPDAVALIFEDQHLTYRQLNERANQLAHYLRRLGVSTETLVGLLCERSVEMVVGVLGTLKAGGVYVPLDPGYPQQRISFILKDASVRMLLTQERLRESLPEHPVEVLSLDAEWEQIARESQENPVSSVQPENLAYVIYTSGSTGAPKGVLVQRASVSNLATALEQRIYAQLPLPLRVAVNAPLSFDASVKQLVRLLFGDTLCLIPDDVRLDSQRLLDYLHSQQVDVCDCTPTQLLALIEAGLLADEERAPLAMLVGGEAIDDQLWEQLASAGKTRFWNVYGPTECTVDATACLIESVAERANIGGAIANAEVYVLDRNGALVPIGVPGELYIGGAGVARGYLKRPDLTAERFLPHPYSRHAGERLYRTGDIVRFGPDGTLEYIGRTDNQVKIRGHRIELREIEASLLQNPRVREAVVLAKENESGGKRLIAYVVAEGEEALTSSELRSDLKERLPEYMLPSIFVMLEEFPLTPNGKVDRRALPEPVGGRSALDQSFVSPRDELEEALTKLWREVLGIEAVGVKDNFFELGGHSLLATQILSRVRSVLHMELSLRDFFANPTLEGMAEIIRSAPGMEHHLRLEPLKPASRNGGVMLSFAQQRLWFLEHLHPGSPLYHMPSAVCLKGELNFYALEQSLNEVIRRHEVLRTTFKVVEGQPLQFIAPEFYLSVPIKDLQPLPQAGRMAEVQRLATEETWRTFDLIEGPLIRATLLRLSRAEHVLLLTMHHIISDGWSIGLLIKEIAALYDGYVKGEPVLLPELSIQYADYAVWQREWLKGEVLEEQLSYWRTQLSGNPAVLELPADKTRPSVQSFRGATQLLTLPQSLLANLNQLSRQEGVTLFTTLLATFQVLLHRYTGEEDIVVGTPIAGRNQTEIENLIGLFVNTLVLRTDISGNPTFLEFLGRVKEVVLGAYTHQDLPFEKLVEELQPERDLSRAPLFQVMFVLQNTPMPEMELAGLTVELLGTDNKTAKFDFILTMEERGDVLTASVEYSTDLFEAATIKRALRHFQNLLESIVAAPEQRIKQLPMLSEREREQLLYDYNQKASDGLPTQPLHHLFESQVERTPDSVALVFGNEQLTYRQLNERANQLAHHLQQLGVRPETLVGILMERSLEMVVAILGTLKAGGAYVPLDPTYPQERLSFILEDAAVKLLLTQGSLKERLPQNRVDFHYEVVSLDADWEQIAQQSKVNPVTSVRAENAAYVIYTSGSTGTPKGVLVEHSQVCRLLQSTEYWFNFTSADTWTLFHSIAFDFSVWELWGALAYGGRLVVVPYWVSRTPAAFYQLLVSEQVTVLNQTPSAFRQLIQAEAEHLDVASERGLALRVVIFGGEALELQSLQPWIERHGDEQPQLINMYGITETTVHVTYRRITLRDLEKGRGSVIGQRIADLELYLLDEELKPVPIGVAAEIYVGGAGVARGYLKRAALTAERFIPHPYSGRPGGRLYRTGDVGRRLLDGDVEYLGRSDEQVKVRGFRIELGEIEAVLNSQIGVRDSVVMLREEEGGEKQLVAYVAVEAEAVTGSQLRQALKQRLPDYMVPGRIVMLEQLPLTAHGKVDRRKLREAEAEREAAAEAKYVAARSEVEEVLCAIWSQVLGVERVGVTDNYFALGGDSIRSVRVLALAKDRGLDISFQDLFQFQTISELAQQLQSLDLNSEDEGKAQAFDLISAEDRLRMPQDVEDAYPLTMLQAGMLFHSEYDPESHAYHNVSSFHLRAPFDAEALRTAVQHLVERHPVLRTSFDLSNYGEPLQLVHRMASVPLQVEDISYLSQSEQEKLIVATIENEKKEKIDWTRAPLLRIRAHRRSGGTFQFTLTEHHAILDGWSVASLLTELFHRYVSLLEGGEGPGEKPPLSLFREYVALERAALNSEESRNFWAQRLSDGAPTKLPRCNDELKETSTGQLHKVEIPLSTEISNGLRRLAQTVAVPLKSVLLAAHLRVLSLLSGERDVQTGLVSHGRSEEIDGERVLGLFLNTLPFRQYLNGGTWADLARLTFEREREMLAFRRYPLAQIQKDLGGQPLFETAFNFTHFHVYRSLQEINEVEVLSGGTFAKTNFVLTSEFSLDLHTSEVQLHLNGDANRLSVEQIEIIGNYYGRTLKAMASDPLSHYAFTSLLLSEEQRKLLVEVNETARDYPLQGCVHTLFEAQAERTPDALALVYEDERLTYRQLNERANQLAHYLRRLGVSTETLVGILCDRSIEMIVGVLGTLKAGGAYVPLDSSYPQQRLSLMVEDAQVGVLLTQEHLSESLLEQASAVSYRVISLDTEWASIAAESRSNPLTSVQPENVAYVIYTSGSTGAPKGVLVQHASVCNLAFALHERIYTQLPLPLRVAVNAPLSFDASVKQLVRLLFGDTLCLIPEEVRLDSQRLLDYLHSQQVDVCDCTPTQLLALIEAGLLEDERSALVAMLVGGEAIDEQLWEQLASAGKTRFWNVYGPTECTVDATVCPVENVMERTHIGEPIANAEIYVLDSNGIPAPVGVAGELYIGGAGVARGYLKRPDLTAERFLPHPYSRRAGERLYWTGDVVRYGSDGKLEFVGRADNQVKIRGHRIEVGEIEAALRENAQVREAVVLAKENESGGKRLIAYVVAEGEEALAGSELRSDLKERLPEYMLPSSFIVLEEFPLTPNGKVDRRALPEPNQTLTEFEADFIKPRDMLEFRLAQIWEEVFEIHPVGIRHSFFELGGHSILAVRLMAKVRQTFDCNLSVATLFQAETIERLASIIRREEIAPAHPASLVVIQSKGTGRPFFCVHPIGGSVICYSSLARQLGSHHPFYALQSRGIESEHEPLKTIEEMAAKYIQELQEVQAEGPYLLGGWSMGGVIAFEMAKQLSAQGHSIALLAVIDSAAPSDRKRDVCLDDGQLLSKFLADLCSQSTGDANTVYVELQALGGNQQTEALLEKIKEADGLLPDIEAEQIHRLFNVFKANAQAAANYVAQPYTGAITFLKASATDEDDSNSVSQGWAELALGGLRVETVPGNHYTILQKPNVQILSERLLSFIGETETEQII